MPDFLTSARDEKDEVETPVDKSKKSQEFAFNGEFDHSNLEVRESDTFLLSCL